MDVRNAQSEVRDRGAAPDPRTRLVQEKYFTMRPQPLERWLWRQHISATAERIFWFHWAEGARSGDWCSQAALSFVAQECEVDPSTVTRAYQVLIRLGVLRRTDPGRDPANPFARATSITEVLLPQELLQKLHGMPNRPRLRAAAASCPSISPAPAPVAPTAPKRPADPYRHLSLAERRERMRSLSERLSRSERERWHQAVCGSASQIEFDPDTQIPAAVQAEMNQFLAARRPTEASAAQTISPRAKPTAARRLSVFEVARVRREVQRVSGTQNGDELARQVLWAIEGASGSLRQFTPAHALNIALKMLRVGQWQRPHRMPPNWIRQVREDA
jgi:hypothetical protein